MQEEFQARLISFEEYEAIQAVHFKEIQFFQYNQDFRKDFKTAPSHFKPRLLKALLIKHHFENLIPETALNYIHQGSLKIDLKDWAKNKGPIPYKHSHKILLQECIEITNNTKFKNKKLGTWFKQSHAHKAVVWEKDGILRKAYAHFIHVTDKAVYPFYIRAEDEVQYNHGKIAVRARQQAWWVQDFMLEDGLSQLYPDKEIHPMIIVVINPHQPIKCRYWSLRDPNKKVISEFFNQEKAEGMIKDYFEWDLKGRAVRHSNNKLEVVKI